VDVLYTAQATARGGREGEVVTDDGVLDLQLAYPKELGGPAGSDKTNPEQLFAAGYAACFLNALKRVAKESGTPVDDAEMTARVGLGQDGPGFGLAVTLQGRFPGLDDGVGRTLMDDAHQVCPYSRATRGNVEVTLEVV
jgi:lipoyl-dependent peroxiredoxin